MIAKILTSQRLLAFLFLGFGVVAACVLRRAPEPSASGLAGESLATRESSQRVAMPPEALSPIFVVADSIDAPSREFQAIAASEQVVVRENHPQPDASVYFPKTFNEGFAKARIGPSIPRDYSIDPRHDPNTLSQADSRATVVVDGSQSNSAVTLRLKPLVSDSHWPDQDYQVPAARDHSQPSTHFRASLDPPKLITNQSFAEPLSTGILSSSTRERSDAAEKGTTQPRDRDRNQSHVIRQPVRQRPN